MQQREDKYQEYLEELEEEFDMHEHTCEYCGHTGYDVILTEVPYDSEIDGDHSLHYLCPNCIAESEMDI